MNAVALRLERGVGRGLEGLRASGAWRLTLVLLILTACVACGSTIEPEVTFKPEFLPVELVLGPSGFSIEGNDSLATPIGSFSIGAHFELPAQSQGSIYVILRDRKTGYDRIFQIFSGNSQFTAVVNGTTSISITKDQVLIDVTDGDIKKIAFKRVNDQLAEQSHANLMERMGHRTTSRWDEGWSESWYKPYALARWAYDQSTIDKWFGVGFVWFLLRLVLALILGAVDTILSLGFLLGQVAFIIFGPTGRDIVYGLLVLAAIAAVGIGASDM
jgi:hypothetical protein